ncbi:precorrin-3B synthase [Bartonella tamiae Th307]|uniref:Precorrin-3B synthase n=2 Tax=Bartonella tamiae TaxID=373638 RepID=J0ZKE7_9HYPH|nr:precorrin-3B synthase [Bartonella tamiae Th239]EJF94922.1 precorrin-3B synthase [Bartonella tamiae Th307]
MLMSKDGGLCRIKLSFGQITSKQIKGIAKVAEEFGNKKIEITNRANIQLRGLDKENYKKIIHALDLLGLGPLTPKSDDIRNVMLAPTAGIDPDMHVDTLPLGNTLLHLLQTNEQFQNLSPKFSFLINAGEKTAIDYHKADIWFSFHKSSTKINFGFASCSDFLKKDENALGSIALEDFVKFVKSCLNTFIAQQALMPEITRMKHIEQTMGFKTYLGEIKKFFPCNIHAPIPLDKVFSLDEALIGIFQQYNPDLYYVGANTHLGVLTVDQIYALSRILDYQNKHTRLRLTPRKGLIFSNLTLNEAKQIQSEFNDLGFCVSNSEPSAQIICCAGAPACHSGVSNVHRDSQILINELENTKIPKIHLTACEKACVANKAYPYTALAKEDGFYDLFCKDPTIKHKFGKKIADRLSINQLAVCLKNRHKRHK